MHVRDVTDQLLNEDGFADAGAAEQTDFTAARVGRHEIDDLDPRLEDARRRLLVLKFGRGAVNRPVRRRLHRSVAVDRLPENVEDAPQRAFADGHRDRAADAAHGRAADKPIGRPKRETAHLVIAQLVLHLERQLARRHRRSAEIDAVRGGRTVAARVILVYADTQRIIDLRQRLGIKFHVHDVAEHLDDLSGISSHSSYFLTKVRC